MTLDEALMFNGSDIEEYQKLIKKRQRYINEIKKLSNKIHDEDDSISVFNGKLNERDTELLNRHKEERQNLIEDRKIKQNLLDIINQQIGEMQR